MRSQRKRHLFLGLGLTVALGLVVGLPPAAATTETFVYTGAAQTWTVPAGVSQATFDLYGAQGGEVSAFPQFFPGGLGGRATATIGVTPGGSIQVNVGGQGSPVAPLGNPGGGGGGASDIRGGGTTLTNRVLVAGGGGGSGGNNCASPPSGGKGGGEVGEAGLAGLCPGAVAGGGGTQDTGGTAAAPATEGDFGVGGNGGFEGGGGGGGWYGGGGGNDDGGGGGGSGHGPLGTVFETGARSGNGLVTVTYTAAPTSKSQCKNNGWRAFPQFKNQGQCERSVKV